MEYVFLNVTEEPEGATPNVFTEDSVFTVYFTCSPAGLAPVVAVVVPAAEGAFTDASVGFATTDAKRYTEVSINEVVEKQLQVVDMTASILAMENHMPMLMR